MRCIRLLLLGGFLVLLALLVASIALKPRFSSLQVFQAFSPDGKRLAVATHHGDAQFWDLSRAQPHGLRTKLLDEGILLSSTVRFIDNDTLVGIRCLNEEDQEPLEVVFWNVATDELDRKSPIPYSGIHGHRYFISHDGVWLLVNPALDEDPKVDVWRLDPLEKVKSIKLPIDPWALHVSADASTFAFTEFGGSGGWRVWDRDRALSVATVEGSQIAFSWDGKYIAYGPSPDVEIRDLATGQIRRMPASEHTGRYPVEFSADGRFLLCGAEGDTLTEHRYSRWDTTSDAIVLAPGDGGRAYAGAFSPRGDLACLYGDPNVSLWNADAGSVTPLRNISLSGLPDPTGLAVALLFVGGALLVSLLVVSGRPLPVVQASSPPVHSQWSPSPHALEAIILTPPYRLPIVLRLPIFLIALAIAQAAAAFGGLIAGILMFRVSGNKWIDLDTSNALIPTVQVIIGTTATFSVVLVCRLLVDRRSLASMGLASLRRTVSNSPLFAFAIGAGPIATCFALIAAFGGYRTDGLHFSTAALVFSIALALAAFSDEVVFRGYLLGNFVESRFRVVGVIVSSLLFCLIRNFADGWWANWLFAVNIFLFGLLLSLAYLLSRNIWFTSIVHFAWLFAQFVFLDAPLRGESVSFGVVQLVQNKTVSPWITGGELGFEASAVTTVVLVVMVFLLLALLRRATSPRAALIRTEEPLLAEVIEAPEVA